jgi:uncharacterized protein YjlB
MTHSPEIIYESHLLQASGWCPNNPVLPLLVYRSVQFEKSEDLAVWFEAQFASHGWPPSWRYTIYDYAHYHSTCHEVIGVYRGSASVCFGDRGGVTLALYPGDVVVIPAGVSHQRLESTPTFHAVGAYPAGCEPDMRVGAPGERPAADDRIASLAVPMEDPVYGGHGPLWDEWKKTG